MASAASETLALLGADSSPIQINLSFLTPLCQPFSVQVAPSMVAPFGLTFQPHLKSRSQARLLFPLGVKQSPVLAKHLTSANDIL